MAVINPGLTPAQATPGLWQFDPIMLPKWRTARAKALAIGSTSLAKVLCINDSTGVGEAAGSGASQLTGAHDRSVSARLAAALARLGLPGTSEGQFGQGNVLAYTTMPLYNPRITLGAGWISQNNPSVPGGSSFQSSNNTDAITYLPEINVRTFVIWALTNSPLGTLSITIDGGAPTTGPATFNTGIAESLTPITVKAAAAGSHTLSLIASAGVCNIGGIQAYDDTKGGIDIMNMGWGASASSDWNNSAYPWSPLPGIGAYAPDLTIIGLGINDNWKGTTPAAFTANIQALITEAKLSGDVILEAPHGIQVGFGGGLTTLATQATISAIYKSLAASNNLPCIDWPARYGSWVTANAAGWMYDGAHGLAPMYEDKAALLARVLAA